MNNITIYKNPEIGGKSPAESTISQQAIEPVLVKAEELLKFYEQATGCAVSVLDQNNNSISGTNRRALFFCSLCRKFYPDQQRQWKDDEYPCTLIFREAAGVAQRLGGSYISMCKMGFADWISPIYSGGRFAGSLFAGRVLGIERERVVENILLNSGGKLTESQILKFLEKTPEASYEEVKANAQMLLICAKKISKDSEESGKSGQPFSCCDFRLLGSPGFPTCGFLSWNDMETEKQTSFLENERLLLASLRRGDSNEARKILNLMISILSETSSENFESFRLHAIQLVVLLSRVALRQIHSAGHLKAHAKTPGRNSPSGDSEYAKVFEANNRYLKKIEECRDATGLTEILHVFLERMSGMMFSFHGCRHSSALRKAERFIWENYTRKISLQEIADASGLSAPYFSTIFKEEMGENLSNYLNRLRVGKARDMLTETELALCEVAAACGFEDQSWFSKIFKSHTGISPGKYRETGGNILSGRRAH
ncbi:MAG: helix-turn-helix domain-containing protein [Treponema sp.]|jgi:AraC-like DNA-binding protein/ligand-binding sensor protein|nr:helix-turn-helix domain-containing protein [Treponema sp.]